VNDASSGTTFKVNPRTTLQDRKCSCIPSNTPIPQDHLSSFWSCPLPWDSTWSATEARKEQSRRLCWSALNLVASYTSRCALFNKKTPDFFLSDPANVCRFCPHNLALTFFSSHSVRNLLPWGGGASYFFTLPTNTVTKRVRLGSLLSQHAALEFLPPTAER